jgi:hypothetical protein
LGSSDIAFFGSFGICFRAKNTKNTVDFIIVDFLYFTNDGIPNHTFYRHWKRRMELQKKHWFVLKNYEKDKNQYILLEPAGYIPYFSGLKAIDEVGLVDKEIQKEIKKISPTIGETPQKIENRNIF